jgi:hypothetical protein
MCTHASPLHTQVHVYVQVQDTGYGFDDVIRCLGQPLSCGLRSISPQKVGGCAYTVCMHGNECMYAKCVCILEGDL